MEKKKILVAMSGGVDSSVAAALLKEEGHDVAGATIRTWASNECADLNTRACCGLSGVEDAREVADTLGIPYWVFNFEKEFKENVIDYFASEYRKGRTPNPCIACNEHIKFRLFLKRAQQLGYDYIATGHYARREFDPVRQVYYLAEGFDPGKDQSYVLFPLGQDLLPQTLLPIGGFTKAAIREKARALNLCVMNKPDSQEICFIPSNDYGSFLKREYSPEKASSEAAFVPTPGIARTKDGKVLGEHEGYFHYTRGQRRGLGIAHTERLYVIETDPVKNEVVLGAKEDVINKSCTVSKLKWFLKPDTQNPVRIQTKIRSQHTKAWSQLRFITDEKVQIDFDDPQDAITPGQAAVFYDGTKVIGGGWIENYL